MKIVYKAILDEPLLIDDHWPAPFMDGEFRLVSDGDKIIAFEVEFHGKSTALAPEIKSPAEDSAQNHITIRDDLQPFVEMQLRDMLSYIQCYFDVEISIDEIEVSYFAENDEEREKLHVHRWQELKSNRPLALSYDYFTRAIMAADNGSAPVFEATLVTAARKALNEEKFIDSFRYSFLLIEATYGDGKFRTAQLRDAFKTNQELQVIVETVLKEPLKPKYGFASKTKSLLATKPSSDQILDHLVEMRGFYFHGNANRRRSWRPQDQKSAEILSLIAVDIAMAISHSAAAPMYAEEFSKRHFDDAKRIGAIMTNEIRFTYSEPGEESPRSGQININVPGTRATGKMAMYVAQKFFERLDEVAPTAILRAATCSIRDTNQPIFDMRFHIGGQVDTAAGMKSALKPGPDLTE
jgi:hypothetical protein